MKNIFIMIFSLIFSLSSFGYGEQEQEVSDELIKARQIMKYGDLANRIIFEGFSEKHIKLSNQEIDGEIHVDIHVCSWTEESLIEKCGEALSSTKYEDLSEINSAWKWVRNTFYSTVDTALSIAPSDWQYQRSHMEYFKFENPFTAMHRAIAFSDKFIKVEDKSKVFIYKENYSESNEYVYSENNTKADGDIYKGSNMFNKFVRFYKFKDPESLAFFTYSK